MKNIVKCYKDFFGYFNALKTHCGGSSATAKAQRKNALYWPAIFSYKHNAQIIFDLWEHLSVDSEIKVG